MADSTEKKRQKIDIENLPDDPSALKDLLLTVLLENQDLKHKVHLLLEQSYGRKGEPFTAPGQTSLLPDETLKKHSEAEKEEAEEEARPRKKRKKGEGRKPLPKDLKRETEVVDIPEEEKRCKTCEVPLVRIGEEVTEKLDYIPASVFVREIVRPKYACRGECEGNVVIADLPDQPIWKGIPGAGLLAHVVTSKYADHLPLHRLEGILARHGVEVSRKTMCDWVQKTAGLLHPLHALMKEEVLKSEVLHTDDTPVKVQDPLAMKTRTSMRQGRVWTYVGDSSHPYVVFDYTENRSRDGPATFLKGYDGTLQADAYAGYDHLYKEKLTEAACWAHGRRKFYDARGSFPTGAAETALTYIQQLYKIEEEIRDKAPKKKKRIRQRKAKPIVLKFKKWIDSLTVFPKTPFGKAVTYTISQWEALTRYLEDGRVDIDNNAAERALRPVAVGRKNFLFFGSDRGGSWASVLLSLVATCKRHKIDPFEYLRDVIDRLPSLPENHLPELLPPAWKKARQPHGIATVAPDLAANAV